MARTASAASAAGGGAGACAVTLHFDGGLGWFDVWVVCRVLFVQRLVMDVAIVDDDDKREEVVRWGDPVWFYIQEVVVND